MKHSRFITAVLLLVPSLVLAQAQGRVKGTVVDSKGNPIVGATVTVTSSELTTFRKETTSDKRGEFTVLFVDATKRFKFHIEAKGYQGLEEIHKPLIGHQTLEVEFKLKSVEEAVAAEEQQVLAQPGYKELAEAKACLDQGKREEAKTKLRAAIAAKADLYVAFHELGRLEYEDKQWAESLADAEKCLALKPGDTPCIALALNAAKEAGNQAAYDRHLAEYKMANPGDPGIMFNDAAAYLNKGDDGAAKPILEKILEAAPDHADSLFQLGMVYLRAGDNAKAKELLQKFLKVAPDHKEAPTATEMLKYL